MGTGHPTPGVVVRAWAQRMEPGVQGGAGGGEGDELWPGDLARHPTHVWLTRQSPGQAGGREPAGAVSPSGTC